MQGFVHRLPTRILASFLALLVAGLGCEPSATLAPESGARQYQQPGFVPVPGGMVNAAGGNLLLERLDLSIDTLLGPWELRASYDALSGAWLWNFQIRYDGESFLDPSGAVHEVGELSDGAAIAGTVWVKADADTIETRGGLGFHFDAQGRLDHVAWRSGDYPRIEYSWTPSALQMASCTQAAACLPFYAVALDAAGKPLSAVDLRTGRTAEFIYDALGRLEVARSALDVAEDRPGIRYEYGGPGTLLSAVTSSESERIEYAYQAGRRIWRITQIGEGNPFHEFRFLAKDAEGLYTTVHENPLGGRARYVFDKKRRLRRLELSDAGEVYSWAWSGLRPFQATAPGGVITAFGYLDDDLVSLTEPSGNVVELVYAPGAVNLEDPFARPLARVEDSVGLVEERSYDALGRLESVRNGEGEAVHLERGPVALASFTNAAGLTWSFPFYGIHGHWLEVQGATQDKRAFDPVGNATATGAGSQEGGVLTRGYDANRNLTALHVAATEAGSVLSQDTVTVGYRSDGQIDSVARPLGADHDFVYDAIGRLTELREKVDGVWQATRFEYDAAGNLSARERPNGMREEWGHDVYGRVTRHRALRDGQLEGEAVVTWQDGRPASHSDSIRGSTELYGYDSAGRLQTVLYGFGESLTLEHDLRSRRTAERFALPGQGEIRRLDHEYDQANREVRVSADGSELLVELVYTDGQLARTRYGNGLERDHQYDPVTGHLVATTTTDATGQVVEQTAIARAARQEPVRFAVEVETTTVLATTREEHWLGVGGSLGDPDLLVGQRVWHWTDASGSDREFVYDGLSNQLDNSSGDVFVYNPEASRLLQATLASGETQSYSYDAAGFADSRNGLPIEWTATGRLASYDGVAIDWDLSGRPLAITAAGLTREFVFFGGGVDSDPQTGALGALDLGVVQLSFGSNARLYRHRDFRGNVSFVTDETGAVRTHYHYSAYGVEAAYGALADNPTFAGGRVLGALLILGARIYDPAVGRFLSPDPVFQLLNQYSYTFGNPVFYWDPDGTQQSLAEAEAAYADAKVKVAAALGAFLLALGFTLTALSTGGPVGAVGVALRSGTLIGTALALKWALDELARAEANLEAAREREDAKGVAGVGGGASGAAFQAPNLANFGSGPCRSHCFAPSFAPPEDIGPACAPTTLVALPKFPWALAVLIPLQVGLSIVVLRRLGRKQLGVRNEI